MQTAEVIQEPMDQCAENIGMSIADLTALLTRCVELDNKKKVLSKDLDRVSDDLKAVKERVANVYIQMGVKSMKAAGKNIYINKEIWAGIAEDTSRDELSQALVAASLEDFITCNAQKLSGYVREIVASHPEFYDEKDNLTASPEEILEALPEPFNKMFKISEKIDIRIRK